MEVRKLALLEASLLIHPSSFIRNGRGHVDYTQCERPPVLRVNTIIIAMRYCAVDEERRTNGNLFAIYKSLNCTRHQAAITCTYISLNLFYISFWVEITLYFLENVIK